jgi:hypothetical protein
MNYIDYDTNSTDMNENGKSAAVLLSIHNQSADELMYSRKSALKSRYAVHSTDFPLNKSGSKRKLESQLLVNRYARAAQPSSLPPIDYVFAPHKQNNLNNNGELSEISLTVSKLPRHEAGKMIKPKAIRLTNNEFACEPAEKLETASDDASSDNLLENSDNSVAEDLTLPVFHTTEEELDQVLDLNPLSAINNSSAESEDELSAALPACLSGFPGENLFSAFNRTATNVNIDSLSQEICQQARDLLKQGSSKIPTSLLSPRLLLFLSNQGYLSCVDGHFPQFISAAELNEAAEQFESNNKVQKSAEHCVESYLPRRYIAARFSPEQLAALLKENSGGASNSMSKHATLSALLAEQSSLALQKLPQAIKQPQPANSPVPPPPLPANLARLTQQISTEIRNLYNLSCEERGHKTVGHGILTEEDYLRAAEVKCDLLYGEVLPEGCSRMFDADHLDLATVSTLWDLGSGLGKLAIQAFLQYPNLISVKGVELAKSRAKKGFDALRKLARSREKHGATAQDGADNCSMKLIESFPAKSNRSTRSKKVNRSISLFSGDLFTCSDCFTADCIVCETKFPEEKYAELCSFLRNLKTSVRLLTYEDLDVVYTRCGEKNPFVRYENNHCNDRFYTSWASNYGYRFHLWRKKEFFSVNNESKEQKE